MIEKIEDVMKNMLAQGRIPCLKKVSLDTKGDRPSVDFGYSRLDFKEPHLDPEDCFSGYVMGMAERELAQSMSVYIPQIYDTKNTSADEDLRAFASGLMSCANGPGARVLLQKGKLSVAADFFIPGGASDAQLQLSVHDAIHSAINIHYRWLLYMWKWHAERVLSEDAMENAIDVRLGIITESIGSSALGEEVGGTV